MKRDVIDENSSNLPKRKKRGKKDVIKFNYLTQSQIITLKTHTHTGKKISLRYFHLSPTFINENSSIEENSKETLIAFPPPSPVHPQNVTARGSAARFVWAWDHFVVRGEVVNYGTPWVTFQWMIDERPPILI